MLRELFESYDVCVVGGGLAGTCAAIAAAREGAKVVLVQERPVLGGNTSSEIRMWVCGAKKRDNRETGILEEIMLENLYRNPTKNFYIWDTILLDFVKREKNITLHLNTTCMDAKVVEGNFTYGRTKSIVSIKAYQMTSQTNFILEADYFIDCSGDSILAPLTGADFRMGRESAEEFGEQTHVLEPDNMTMGSSCLITGRETTKYVPYVPSENGVRLTEENVKNRPMNLYNSEENFWYLELGGNRHTINDAEQIGNELLNLATGTWDYIKTHKEYHADNWELDFLGFLPGKRESRRMMGEYIITQKDVMSNKQYEDAIAFGGWPLDDHYPAGYYHVGTPNTDFHTPSPYSLPYRALYSRNVENLFFAGRNISMTHTAMSSIRVMATCALLGEAAGTAAAMATSYHCTPHDIYLSHREELKERLQNQDSFLPYDHRTISEECKTATLLHGSDALRDAKDRVHPLYGDNTCGDLIMNETEIQYCLKNSQNNLQVHLVFDSDLNRDTLPGDPVERTHATRANIALDSPVMCMPKTLCKEFTLRACHNGKEVYCLDVKENRKRSYHISIPETVDEIVLVPHSNYGGSDHTAVFSFDF